MRIGVVVGSIRDGRAGRAVGDWVKAGADAHGGADFEVVDLKDFDVPLLTDPTPPGAADRQYPSPAVREWGATIDRFDGFVFVSPEYNHSVPGAFKNAVDSLGPEWQGKTVGFVGYGADNGVRAVEHWRQILANFSIVDVRGQVSLGLFTDFGDSGFAPLDRRAGELDAMLDQLIAQTERQLG